MNQATPNNVLYTLFCQHTQQQKRSTGVCFDIIRAIDRMWYPGVLEKLSALGFSGTLHAWLTDYLKNRSLKVVSRSVFAKCSCSSMLFKYGPGAYLI